MELYGDINSCRYGAGPLDTNTYLACLHNAHDVLQFPNGRILAWAKEDVPWYYGADEPSLPLGETGPTHPPAIPNTPLPELSTASATPQEGSLSPEMKQKMLKEGENALALCGVEKLMGGRHSFRCVARYWVTGMGVEVVKRMVYNRSDVIQQLPVNAETKNDIIENSLFIDY